MALVNGKSYRFKSSNGQYLNVLTDGTPTNGTNVTTYSLDASDMAQVWEYTYYSSSATGTSGHILKCAKNPALCLDRYRASSNLNNADVYRIGTTTADLNDQYVTVTQKSGNNYTIKLTNNNLFLTTTSTATYGGYNVNWQTETGGTNQLWTAEEYGGSSGGDLNINLRNDINSYNQRYSSKWTYACAGICGCMDIKKCPDDVPEGYLVPEAKWNLLAGLVGKKAEESASLTSGSGYPLSDVLNILNAGYPVIVKTRTAEVSSYKDHWVIVYGYK